MGSQHPDFASEERQLGGAARDSPGHCQWLFATCFCSCPTRSQRVAAHLTPRAGGRGSGGVTRCICGPPLLVGPPPSSVDLVGYPSTPSREAAWSECSRNNGVCIAFPFQMYIALISLHALIMVGFHFLHCFEEDWTSEYAPGIPPCGGCGPWGRALYFCHGARSQPHFIRSPASLWRDQERNSRAPSLSSG